MVGPPAVVVEMAPEPAASFSDAALASCNGALGGGRCERFDAEQPSVGEYYALVRQGASGIDVLHIEFREHTRDGRLIAERDLEFARLDTPRERWASVGVVIAALVAAQHPSAPEPAETPKPSEPVRPEPAPALEAERPLRLDLGMLLSAALENSRPELGGTLRASFVLLPLPIFLSASIAQEFRLRGQPSVDWQLAAAGLGARLLAPPAAIGVELRAELAAERVGISATRSGLAESAHRTRFGPRLGLDAVLAVSARSSVVLGAQVAMLRPAVTVEIDGQQAERAPQFSWGLLCAFRYAP